jgi:ribosomal protein S12 methylthiotransferase
MLKKTVPDIALRTNFITGFPGETQKDFSELKKFVKDYQFDNIGIFEYHREPGTPAYGMRGQIPAAVKKQRARELARVQSRVVDKLNRALIGQTVEVISDTPLRGRTYKDAPDIDGALDFSRPVQAGGIFKAKIIKAKGYQRTAEVA